MHALALLALLATDAPLLDDVPKTDADVVRALAEHYTKHEFDIPMRDGVKLHTDVWEPKPTTVSDARAWPFLFTRTPYSIPPYGNENMPDDKNHRALTRFVPSRELLRSGYIIVHQDVRGRMMSEGTFVDVKPMADPDKKHAHDPTAIDESTDAWDSIDWLIKHVPHNNGRVGMWGISYPGFYAAQAAVDAHPGLKAVAPMAPVTEWFLGDDFHHNGAFFVADALSFYANFGKPRPVPTTKGAWDFAPDVADVYDFHLQLGPLKNINATLLHDAIPFWNELLSHDTRDAWWQARDPRAQYMHITPAVLVVGGWFDAEDLWGALHTYASMNTATAHNRVSLVMGPWSHGGWHRSDGDVLGDISFHQKTSERYRSEVETPFFESHLKGNGSVKTPEAFVFLTGNNEWRAFDAWPPKEAHAQSLYLHDNGALSSSKPTATTRSTDSFVADPHHPVPYRDGASADIDKTYMTADQRFTAHRPDVLTYTTPVLHDDVTVAGPIDADVFFQTTGTDADVVVKLIDVWPENTQDPEPNPKGIRLGGYQQLVRGEVMRARFRNSFEKPEALVPNQVTRVRFTLPDVGHTFRTGHRIEVQVQSSWFPLVDRNAQTFTNLATADDSAFVTQTHTVWHTAGMSTSITLPVLEGKLPE
jgi:hypothetical protein